MNRTTEIIFDNLFSSLCAEYYGDKVEMAPMSAWKWRQADMLRKKVDTVEPLLGIV